MRKQLFALALILVLTTVGAGFCGAEDNAARPSAAPQANESKSDMTAGMVKKIDRNAGKVTISHEPLLNLGMPKMTMIFRVIDPSMLDRMKEGEKIRFVAGRVNGAFTVMQFEPAD